MSERRVSKRNIEKKTIPSLVTIVPVQPVSPGPTSGQKKLYPQMKS